MLIHIGNAWSKLVSCTEEELQFVQDFLSYKIAGFRGKIKRQSLLQNNTFPAGLSRRLIKVAREAGHSVEVLQRAQAVEILPGYSVPSVNWSPREHQKVALDAIRERRRGLIQHATGGGKSDLIGLLSALIQGRVLIIATSKKLQEDLVSRCRKFHVHPGQVGCGHHDTKKRVVVCNDDSLKKLTKQEILSFHAILEDEVHGAAAKSVNSVLMKCLNAEIRLGFSATALDRADKKGLFIVGALGETIHRYTPQQAAADGVIARARLFMPSYQHRYLQDTETYVDWEKLSIATNATRNLMILRLVHETKSPRIVFVRTKIHQQLLVEMIGESCGYVNDETPTDQADATVKKLRSGQIGTLVSTPIYRQGVDIPEIKTVINAAGGKATIDVIQKVGRGSRILQPDGSKKETFEVYDIKDVGCGCLGELHKSCEWLHKHSAERRKAYEKYGYTVEEVQ